MPGLNSKTFSEILNDMVGWVKSNTTKLTNFSVGSVVRTLLESISMEIESLYFQLDKGFKYAMKQSIFNSFGFSQTAPVPSTGQVTMTFREPLPFNYSIPQGYKFATTSILGQVLYFTSTSDASCVTGDNSITIPVQCDTAGAISNVPIDSIKFAVTPYAFVEGITNNVAFTNGKEGEATEEVKRRFTQYIQTLARGTIGALTYGCSSVPGVTGVAIEELVGRVRIYAHNADGLLPIELKNAIITNLLSYRSGGVEVIVLPVVIKPVDITIGVLLEEGFDVERYKVIIKDSIIQYLNSYTVSRGLIRSELIRYTMSIDKLAITDVSISLTSNIASMKSELIRPGVITINNEGI
jgi:uncharacterized phage protein gp47/JayE